MKKYWYLTRVMLKNMLASMDPRNGAYADGQKKRRAVVRMLALLLLSVGAIGSVVFLEYEIYGVLDTIRMPMLLPGMAIFISLVLTMVMGLFQCLSELFQGKDAPFLAVLPLTSRQVFAARMTTLYVSELAVDALICLPAFVMYAVGQGALWPVLATMLPVLLLLPVIPLSVVALIASLLMRVGAFSRHRESVVMALSVVVALAYSIGVTLMNSGNTSSMQSMVSLMVGPEGLVNRMLGIFPPAMWATRGLTGEAWMLLLFAAVSVACAAGVLLLAGPGYLNMALSSTEKTVIHKRKGQGFGWKGSSAFRALHVLEWKQILRTPAWSYNSLLGVLMFPLMIAIGFISGFSKAGDTMESLREAIGMADPAYVALVAAAVILFCAMVNPAVSTAISREGGCWPFALTLPVRQKTRFLAKLMVGVEINAVCMALVAAVAWYLVRMPLIWLLAAFGLATVIGLASATLSLWVDAMRPQLHWTTEMEAIKKNYNQVIGMMLWAVLTALCVIPAVLLWSSGGGAALLGTAGVAAAELAISAILLHRAAEKHAVLQE